MAFESTGGDFWAGRWRRRAWRRGPGRTGCEELKLGVASYSLREFQRGLAIRMNQAVAVAYVGIKEVHLPTAPRRRSSQRPRAFHRCPVSKIAGGSTIYLLNDDDDDIRYYFEYAKSCGMPLMVIGTNPQALRRREVREEYGIAVAPTTTTRGSQLPLAAGALKAIQEWTPAWAWCIDVVHTTRTASGRRIHSRAGSRCWTAHEDLRTCMEKDSQVARSAEGPCRAEIFKTLKIDGLPRLREPGVRDRRRPIRCPGMAKSFRLYPRRPAGLRA